MRTLRNALLAAWHRILLALALPWAAASCAQKPPMVSTGEHGIYQIGFLNMIGDQEDEVDLEPEPEILQK